MFKVVRDIALVMIGVVLVSAFIAYCFYKFIKQSDALFPQQQSSWLWKQVLASDESIGGNSTIEAKDWGSDLVFDFTLGENLEYAYVTASLEFVTAEDANKSIDLSGYSSIVFSASCTPKNVMTFSLITVDETINNPLDYSRYRPLTGYFNCQKKTSKINIDISSLQTPEWWFKSFNKPYTDTAPDYAHVYSFAFSGSYQSPINTPSRASIEHLYALKFNGYYFAGLIITLLVVWMGFCVWAFKHYIKALQYQMKLKIQSDMPLVAYQKLTLEPQRDKDKVAILRYLTTHYTDANLSLEQATKDLGLNRNKINELLKAELGLTFSSYLNKLRLTEAARLLGENNTAIVADIAYAVGYSNISYFSKLFKEEYGCTPKTFKNIYQK